jgi:hypothetical protein
MAALTVPYSLLMVLVYLGGLLRGLHLKTPWAVVLGLFCVQVGSLFYGLALTVLKLDVRRDAILLGAMWGVGFVFTAYVLGCIRDGVLVPFNTTVSIASGLAILISGLIWKYGFVENHGC